RRCAQRNSIPCAAIPGIGRQMGSIGRAKHYKNKTTFTSNNISNMANRNFQQGPGQGNPQGGRPNYDRGNRNIPQDAAIAGKTQAQWKPEIQNWIKNGISKDTITYADAMGEKLKRDGLTTS